MDKLFLQANPAHVAVWRIKDHVLIAGEMYSRNELQAMRQRGLLSVCLGDYYLPASCGDSPAVRARLASFALGPHLQVGEALYRHSAAWIHGLADNLDTLHLAVPHYRRPLELEHQLSVEFLTLDIPVDQLARIGSLTVSTAVHSVCQSALYDDQDLALRIIARAIATGEPQLSYQGLKHVLRQYPASPLMARAARLLENFNPSRTRGTMQRSA